MALIAGAGNPIGGSNPAGIGQGLNYIGNHAYANSGTFASSQTEYTLLSFSTGTEYVVGELTVSGATDATNPGTGLTSVFTLSMNGTDVMFVKIDTDVERSPMTAVIPILIAPFTEVKLTALDSLSESGRKTSASLVGRVYA